MNEDVLIQLDLPAMHQFLNVLGTSIGEMLARIEPPVEPESIYQIQLAAHEICTNIVDHAYDGKPERIQAAMRLTHAPRQFIIELRDTGALTFDPTRTIVPPSDALELHGRGLMLVRASMDRVTYQTRDGQSWQADNDAEWRAILGTPSDRNVWRLSKRV